MAVPGRHWRATRGPENWDCGRNENTCFRNPRSRLERRLQPKLAALQDGGPGYDGLCVGCLETEGQSEFNNALARYVLIEKGLNAAPETDAQRDSEESL
jgi:hypothetical protein